jgi:hypothetical protein
MRKPRIKNEDITYGKPHNGLPKWVRETAADRGYADAVEPLSLIVTENDVTEAFDCAAHGDGAHCVMAQAGQRLGAKAVYFYRTTAWVDFGTGPIQRFTVTDNVYKNVIVPFDKGLRDEITTGVYPLTPPCPAQSLKHRRKYEKTEKKNPTTNRDKKPIAHAHTDRVVMAARS